MKKVIRHGIFETNSSSTHSICIAEGPLDSTLTSENNTVTLKGGEFGWGVQDFWDADTKANYLYTFCWIGGSDSETCPNQANLETLKKVIEDHTGSSVVFSQSYDEFYPRGYIDHQSHDVAEGLWDSEESLKQFIFGSKSLLVIDNDNH